MLRQICLDYSSLGDFRQLTAAEIRYFYNGIREIVKRRTKP